MAFKLLTVFGLLVAAASAQNTLGLSYEQAKYGAVDPYHNVSYILIIVFHAIIRRKGEVEYLVPIYDAIYLGLISYTIKH